MKHLPIALSVALTAFSTLAFSQDNQLPANTAQPVAEAQAATQEAPVALTEEQKQEQYLLWASNLWESLDQQHGTIQLPNGSATLTVPDNFYYLNPADSEKVLVEIWGNIPGSGQESLGMLFPSEITPFDEDSWAVTLDYEEEGYVSDEDADDIDYADMLADMQESTRDRNEYRAEQGYEPIELIGWAAPPFYDKESHKLHWAKELQFGDDPNHTLNYDIRVLGRRGVLTMTFVGDMSQKDTIDANLNDVLAMASFDQGATYAEFDPDMDTVAAYGIGALIAGKVAAKAGLFAAILILLKKFGVFIVVGFGALFGKFFKRNNS